MNTEKRLISWLLSLFLLLSLVPVAADASTRTADEPDVTFVGASLSLKGDIGLNFFITLPEEIRLDENAYMKFTMGSTIKTVPLSQGMLDASDGSYRYSIPLNAKNMGDNVTAQVYVGDTPVSDTRTLSIKFYADYMIANSSNQKLVELMKAMLNYGAAAQVNFGYDTTNLVNADMSAADRTLPANPDVAKYAHSQSGSETGIEITNASLLLQSETKIRIYFKLASGKTLNDYVFTVDGKEVTPIQSGDEYYIEKPNVAAKDLDTMYTFRLGNRQLTYCGLSYVNQVLKNSKDANLLNLVKALYAYNQAANAYFQPNEEPSDNPPSPEGPGTFTFTTPRDTELLVGETLQLQWTYTGDIRDITFKSGNATILSVNSSGVVTGISEGGANVLAYYGDTKLAQVRIQVVAPATEPTEPEIGPAVSVWKSSNNGSWEVGCVGNSLSFNAGGRTADGVNMGVTASSSNSGVASVSVSNNGSSSSVTVSFKGSGSATITLTSVDGKASTSFTINVRGYSTMSVSTPQDFVNAVNSVVQQNGCSVSSGGNYTVLTLSDSDLTWGQALSSGQTIAHRSFSNGTCRAGCSYHGTNENGEHVFYLYTT